jgi:alpha-1,3-rhamnosyl/mannosyltransferase
MRVAIDATPLLVRSAGVKNYLYYWIKHLRRLAGPDAIRTFPGFDASRPLNHNASTADPLRTFFGLGALAVSNYTPVPVLDWATRGCDVFHATNLVRRPPRGMRLTSTIHDMTSWTMPELHSSATRRADAAAAEILRCADRLIAVSEATKEDAVKVLGIPAERITVIHSGVPSAFFEVTQQQAEAARAKYGLNLPFVFALGTIEPRKNLPRLLAAFAGLPESLRKQCELVLAGPMGWADNDTLADVRNAARARYLGYIPEADLPGVTAAATIFAYPSLYEGFGFPLAQAMAAGTPCVTSNLSSMPEIAGDAALLVDPLNISELRNALERLILTPSLREELSLKGRVQSGRFRWERTAVESLKFFEKLA